MKNTLIFILIVLILPLGILAQGDETIYVEANTSSWGFFGGLNMSKLSEGSTNPTSEDGFNVTWDIDYGTKMKPGFIFGIFYETKIAKAISFQAEASFVRNQQAVKYIQNIEDDANTRRTADYTLKTSSIKIPIFPKFKFGNRIKFWALAGPYISFPVSSSVSGTVTIQEELAAGKPTTYVISGNSIQSNPEKMEFGWTLGGGVKIPMQSDDLMIEVRGGRSFNDVLKSPNYKNSFLTFTIGIVKPI